MDSEGADEAEDDPHFARTRQAMRLERHEVGPWIRTLAVEGGTRASAGLKHSLCEFSS